MHKIINLFQKSIWGQALLILFFWNISIRVVAIIGYFVLPQQFAPLSFIANIWKNNYLFWSFANFDGEHYLSIAKYGYQIRNGFPQYAFFPLLPLLIRGIAIIIRDYYISGLIIAELSLYITLVFIRKWADLLKLPDIRLLLLISTGTIFLASIYTEPLFLALASMSIYFSEKKWWGRAIFTTALASATRVNGIFLVLFLAVKMIQAKRSSLMIGISSLLSATGLLSYMLYLSNKTADFMAWFHAQGAWGKATATSPITTLLSYLRATTYEFRPDLVHLVVVFEVVTTILAILLFIALLRRRVLDIAYWLYILGNLAMPIATGSLGSMPRFYLTMFPLLVVVPGLSKLGKTLYYIFSISVCIIGVILFTRGYWYG